MIENQGGLGGGGIKLASIAITTPPNKTAYNALETFDATGMVVTATYTNGATLVVGGYTVSPSGALVMGTTSVTITYTEGGVSKTATQAITVSKNKVTVPAVSGSLTYNGSSQSPTISNEPSTSIATRGGTASAVNAGGYTKTYTLVDTTNYEWATTFNGSLAWSIGRKTATLTVNPSSITLNTSATSATFTISGEYDGTLSASSNDTSICTVTRNGTTVTVNNVNQTSGSTTITVSVTQGTNYTSASVSVSVTASFITIYGVEWDWTNSTSTKGTRTDAAANFSDPSPAVNNGNGSSPFDNLYPWSGMTKETRTGGVMVKEPKYYFKWTISNEGKKVKLQIADGPVAGFCCDPVNMDRGDGLGELDYSYIARYHCGTSDWKSTTGVAQKVSITRSAARTGIHGLGNYIWQMDFAQMWYVGMLYLVEYADWNGQATIGYGCSASGSKENNGKTDAMTYHTGTTAANRTTYGYTQYRNIEGWWDNVYDWMDGCYYNSNGLNVILNPANFSDTANGTLIGSMPASGYPNALQVSTASGFEWCVRPLTTGGSDSTCVPDGWDFSASSPCLRHGGNYYQYQNRGPFYVYYYSTSSTSDNVGCRLQERPPKAS